MFNKIFVLILIVLFPFCLTAQQGVRERVYLHLNSQNLITGEVLYYSAYCVSDLTGKPSNLSKILYVEIAGEHGTVHQSKISLENGRGQGDMFVSSLIGTGRYQVLAYTRWMKNFDDYFQAPLEIVNPFEASPEGSAIVRTETSMKFYPAGNQIVPKISNIIGFKIDRPISDSTFFKGKIVNASGSKMSEFSHDAFGIGQFELTPEVGERYKAILEDEEGNFIFFDLPNVGTEGTLIDYRFRKNHLDIDVATYPQKDETGKLVLSSPFGELVSKDIKLNSNHLIQKNEGEGNFLFVEVIDEEGNLVAQRTVINNLSQREKKEANKVYSTRENVILNPSLKKGNYSVSIRKKSQFSNSPHSHSVGSRLKSLFSNYAVDPDSYFDQQGDSNLSPFILTSTAKKRKGLENQKTKIGLLPELRDEMIDGKVVDSENAPVEKALVIFSLLDDLSQTRVAHTREDGSFSVPFRSSIKDLGGYLTTANLDSGYSIVSEDPFLKELPTFNYSLKPLDSNRIKEVVDRSIRNQIENAYYANSPLASRGNSWFQQVPYEYSYLLDDYTRFRTIKETFTEYIVTASVRENRTPKIKPYIDNPSKLSYPPLLLLDGIPVEAEVMINFSPYKIESIGILNKRFFLGPLVADGVVSFKTKEKGLGELVLDERYHKVKLMGLSPVNNYTFPDYSEGSLSKRADQRDQLYWNPNIEIIDDSLREITFFTSDVEGAFEIVIEGFTMEGQPISIVEDFEVQDSKVSRK